MGLDTHDHEFREPDEYVYEDAAFYVWQDCGYAEILSSTTSERLDETFYEYGAECEATRHTRLDPTALYMCNETRDDYLMVSDEETIWNGYDCGNYTLDVLLENIDEIIFTALQDDSAHVPPQETDDFQMDEVWRRDDIEEIVAYVTYADQTYKVVFDNASTEVDHY